MTKEISLIKIFLNRSGGNIYKNQILSALSKNFKASNVNLEASYFKNRYLRALESFIKLLFLKGEKDLWIRDFYSTVALNKKNTKGKNLTLIFHMDFSEFRRIPSILLPLLEKLFFYRQLKKTDAIVVISEYWKNYFIKKGYKNIYKIYCGFDLNNFNIKDQEVSEFKERYKLTMKPIIYLGNCQRPKGVVDSYKELCDLDVHFVTSGRQTVKIPASNFDLEYGEYLKLLKASAIVVTMSKFEEGWCMTSHEAMLCKAPVIGSGLGGMKELLEGGGQIICQDFKDLRKKVEFLLNNPEERRLLGEKGYQFAKDFTLERFKREWVDLVDKILNQSRA